MFRQDWVLQVESLTEQSKLGIILGTAAAAGAAFGGGEAAELPFAGGGLAATTPEAGSLLPLR